MAIVPSGAINALGSLLVPLGALVLVAQLEERELALLPSGMLLFITLAALVGLVQTTSLLFDNPFINDAPGEVSGVFANRNHFALLLAVGCLLAPVWAFLGSTPGALGWRGPVAIGLVMLFTMLILISGSRAGLLLGALASLVGLFLVFGRIRGALIGFPRWLLPLLLLLVFLSIGSLVALSLNADRAFGIDRAFAESASDDLRVRATPTVMAMVRNYFPAGTGAGSFDPLFRLHEPFGLLQPFYLNHAHNDFLEVVLEHGLLGALLLLVAAMWWMATTVRAWRGGPGAGPLLARTASVILLLVVMASAVDYPARTPIVMVLLVVAAAWTRIPARAGA